MGVWFSLPLLHLVATQVILPMLLRENTMKMPQQLFLEAQFTLIFNTYTGTFKRYTLCSSGVFMLCSLVDKILFFPFPTLGEWW